MNRYGLIRTSLGATAALCWACVSNQPAQLDAGDVGDGASETETGLAEATSDANQLGPDLGAGATDEPAPEDTLEEWGLSRTATEIDAQWIGFGDFDGDGTLDIFASNFGTGSIWLNEGEGSGSFTLHDQLALPSGGRSIVTGNFMANGRTDIALLGSSSAGAFHLLVNGGEADFGGIVPVPVEGFHEFGTIALRANDDQVDDLFIPQGHSEGGLLALAEPLASFAVAASVPSPACYFSATAAADLDGDGRDELIGTGSCNALPGGLPLMIYRYVEGEFEVAQTVAPPLGSIAEGGDIQLFDVDGDGDLDIVTPATEGLYVVENLGQGLFSDELGWVDHEYGDQVWGARLAPLDIGPAGVSFVIQNRGEELIAPALLVPDVGFAGLITILLPGIEGRVVGARDLDGDGARDLVMLIEGSVELWLSG